MPNYICNRHADKHGYHEIHEDTCEHLPAMKNQIYIGSFPDCHTAIKFLEQANADENYKVDGCSYCCYFCHRG